MEPATLLKTDRRQKRMKRVPKDQWWMCPELIFSPDPQDQMETHTLDMVQGEGGMELPSLFSIKNP